ncbi:MAG: CHASE3 domain-containing protein [Terracidiphilus sp.]|jgi:PAS domain S-box-containing protein
MQTFYKRFSVITGFLLLLLLLAANALVMRHQLAIQLQRQDWVSHTRQVLFQLTRIESLLIDAETGQRGFLYTGDPKYLAPYQYAISRIDPQIDELRRLTADNPDQQARIFELRRLTHAKLDELQQTISLYQAGKPDDAKKLVLSDVGLVYMKQIRSQIDQMNQAEDSLEAVRSAQYRQSVGFMAASIYLATGLAALGLIALAWYILREMELREQHAREIREREEWFRVTLTSIGDAVIATDRHGKVTFLNPVAETLTGVSHADAQGRDIRDVFPIFNEMTLQPVADPVGKVVSLGRVVGLANHTVLKSVNGVLTPIEDSAAPIRDDQEQLIGVVLVFRDVTQERKAQDLLRKTEKLAAAARLSATVAHEINNPLEAVVNLIYIAKAAPGAPPAVVEQLSQAERELDRVAHMTRQTLGFYRESTLPEMIEVPSLIQSVLTLYSNKFKVKNIKVMLDVDDCPRILGVPGELKQVVSNLISNAVDAVNPNGTIRVATQSIDDGAGSGIRIVVEDDGPGVSDEHVDRIFEPFFTTKKEVGTGLGLWLTREIVERHGGTVLVRSREADGVARGASFTIHLPVNANGRNDAHEVA